LLLLLSVLLLVLYLLCEGCTADAAELLLL
jgi:hypothetical protein